MYLSKTEQAPPGSVTELRQPGSESALASVSPLGDVARHHRLHQDLAWHCSWHREYSLFNLGDVQNWHLGPLNGGTEVWTIDWWRGRGWENIPINCTPLFWGLLWTDDVIDERPLTCVARIILRLPPVPVPGVGELLPLLVPPPPPREQLVPHSEPGRVPLNIRCRTPQIFFGTILYIYLCVL